MGEALRIYAAEDEPVVLLGLETMIASLGYSLIGTASDGQIAAAEVVELRPDLVIMDINLPILDGLSAIEIIKKAVNIPCIIITGYNDKRIIERLSNAGIYGFLKKPFDEHELHSAITIAMNRHDELKATEESLNQTQKKLAERKAIERAKGIVMRNMGISEEKAMEIIQKKSRENRIKLANYAQQIIDADELMKGICK